MCVRSRDANSFDPERVYRNYIAQCRRLGVPRDRARKLIEEWVHALAARRCARNRVPRGHCRRPSPVSSATSAPNSACAPWVPCENIAQREIAASMHAASSSGGIVAVGGCNSRTLRDRLKGLEELGIIERTVIAVMPPWVEYGLTDKGQELGNALRRLEEWGRAHMTEPALLA